MHLTVCNIGGTLSLLIAGVFGAPVWRQAEVQKGRYRRTGVQAYRCLTRRVYLALQLSVAEQLAVPGDDLHTLGGGQTEEDVVDLIPG